MSRDIYIPCLEGGVVASDNDGCPLPSLSRENRWPSLSLPKAVSLALASAALTAIAMTGRPQVGDGQAVNTLSSLKALQRLDGNGTTKTQNKTYAKGLEELESRPGRLPGEHRTITMGGFVRSELNGRYTERFGSDFVVNGRETYWNADINRFLYWCPYKAGGQRWNIGYATGLVKIRDPPHDCDYTAVGPTNQDPLDLHTIYGWQEWIDGKLVDAPYARVDIRSLRSTLDEDNSQWDSLDLIPECKRPPYEPIPFTQVYDGTMLRRSQMTGLTEFNQGSCNNCWAISIAMLVERLLCLTSQGQWRGPRAFLSPAYITSCATDAFIGKDGCDSAGGRARAALHWIGKNGVPTGGSQSNEVTCVPFFPVNATSPTHPPACPTECTNPFYPRSLKDDLFLPRELAHSWETTALESAKKAMRSGPIGILIPLYEDFHNYTGGIYQHKTGKLLGNHFMVAHEFSAEYIQGDNSWGPNWGKHGSFRVKPDFPVLFLIPGQVDAATGQGEYSYPFPPALHNLTLSGFKRKDLNGNYIKWYHELGTVNDHITYWKGDDFMMYWCTSRKQWHLLQVPAHHASKSTGQSAGKWEEELTQLKSILQDQCISVAHGPTIEDYKPLDQVDKSLLKGWSETTDDGNDEVIKEAGIAKLEFFDATLA